MKKHTKLNRTRFLLAGFIALLTCLLMGADYPEHELHPDTAAELARELASDIPEDLRSDFLAAASGNSVWYLQLMTDSGR